LSVSFGFHLVVSGKLELFCLFQSVKSWLPEAESKLSSMSPIADSSRAVRIQIEEFKVTYSLTDYSILHSLRVSTLRFSSPLHMLCKSRCVLSLHCFSTNKRIYDDL